jgi:tRNA/tmRNA/rRNA uracil-C5-methylase (TrmA/RlmC/RlmD family)
LIDDIYENFKKEDNTSLTSITISYHDEKKDQKTISDQEIKRIIELFDKKKTIVIPKVEKIDKKENSSIPNGEGKFSIIQNYSQIKFERPKHYIVHSQKNILEPNQKDYEATIHDMNFLKYENSITLDELEKIITELENDINKGEMIPQDRIKEIIIRIIPEKKNHIDKIIKVIIFTILFYIIIVFDLKFNYSTG